VCSLKPACRVLEAAVEQEPLRPPFSPRAMDCRATSRGTGSCQTCSFLSILIKFSLAPRYFIRKAAGRRTTDKSAASYQ
jgi:hypothetical protein